MFLKVLSFSADTQLKIHFFPPGFYFLPIFLFPKFFFQNYLLATFLLLNFHLQICFLLHCLSFSHYFFNFKIRQKFLHFLSSPYQVMNFTIHCYLLRCLNFCYQLVILMLIHLLLDHLQSNFVFLLIIVLQCQTHMLDQVISRLLNQENSCQENLLFLFSRTSLSVL